MPTALHIVPNLGINGAARQVSLLAPELARLGWHVHVAAIERGDHFRTALQTNRISVHDLGRTWTFDPRPWFNLRRLIKDIHPDVVHAWRRPSQLLAQLVIGWKKRPRLLTSDLESTRATDPPFAVGQPRPLDRQLALRELDMPTEACVIACSGAIERDHGFREAVWVFDILKYVYPNLWLLIIGDGSERSRVEEFGRSLGREDFRVRFAGVRSDAAELLGLAEVVWILGRRGGRNIALEAMAAGRPVIARRRSDLLPLLGNDGAGILLDRFDPHEAARATRDLLDDPEFCSRYARQALERVVPFSVDRIARLWIDRFELAMSNH